MKFLFLLTFLLNHATSFAQDIFFEKILLKSQTQQLMIIKKRIKTDAQIKNRLTTQKNVFFYLELPESPSQKFGFLNSIIHSSNEYSFKELTIKSLISYCKINLKYCLDGLPILLNCSGGATCQLIYQTALLEIFEPVHLEYILQQQAIFAKILSFPFPDNALIKRSFRLSVDFGFYNLAKNIISKNSKLTENDTDTLFSKCALLRQTNELKESIECLNKQSDKWSIILNAFTHHLNGDSFDKQGIKNILEKLSTSDPSPRIREFALIMMGLFFKEVTQKLTDTDSEQVASDYYNGYMLLSLNRKLQFIPAEQSLKISQIYSKNFPHYLLTNILDSKVSPKILISSLGTNHFLCKVLEP